MEAKKKIFFLFATIFLSFIFSFVFAQENFSVVPGRIEGRGTHFEIKDSTYLNVVLESSQEIGVVFESAMRTISLEISSFTNNTSTELLIKGLEKNKKYYQYQDGYENGREIFADENGQYSWHQDLTTPHHIWFQEEKGTAYIPFAPRGIPNPIQCEPPYGQWDTETQTCTLLQDLYEGVEITAPNVTLDCAGHRIVGNGSGYGIYAVGKEYVVIKNCNVSNFLTGAYFWGITKIDLFENNFSYNRSGVITSNTYTRTTETVKIIKNTVSNNPGWGLDVRAYYLEAKDNFVFQNYHGFSVRGSKSQIFENNIVSKNTGVGFWLYQSLNSVLRNNLINENKYNLRIEGETPESFIHDIDESNKINGKPIYYLYNKENLLIDSRWGDIGYLGLINSKNITIRDVQISNNGQGILFVSTTNSTIENSELLNNRFGILLVNSSNNQIRQNNIKSVVSPTGDDWGILLIKNSSQNKIEGNTIFTNSSGIYLSSTSNDNQIFHNNFLKKSFSVSIYDSKNNIFDDSFSEGNFWQNEKYNWQDTNRDGINDEPYCFGGGCDRYPFLRKDGWELPKILISEVYYDPGKKCKNDFCEKNGNEEWQNEWLILFNFGKTEINLSNWKICDNSSCVEIKEGMVGPQNFVFISPSSSTLSFWNIPHAFSKIILGEKIGDGLANEGDRIILKDANDKIIDALSYGNDTSIFQSPPKANESKSLLRIILTKDMDLGSDFTESEPTISQNYSPLPIINLLPKNPIKGIEVNFDASSSTDPDGFITQLEWQIKNNQTSETLFTSSATTTSFVFPENGDYTILLTVTDNEGISVSTSTILKVEPFSFALITDLHIGRHYRENYQGEDYYLTERLKNVVRWINENKDKIKCGNDVCSLKFLVLLGDITENTSLAGFCKTKEILDNLEIPYVVVFGNHDVGTDEEYEQCSKWKGEDYFDFVFWSNASIPCERASSDKNFRKLVEELNFERDSENKNYKNFAFSYGGIGFIGLDFVSREKFMKVGPGVGSDAVLNDINEKWLKEKLEEFKEKPIVLLSHHPVIKDRINAFATIPGSLMGDYEILTKILQNTSATFSFGGHIHSFEEFHGVLAPTNSNKKYDPIEKIEIFTTEALMVGSNGRGIEEATKENGVKDGKKGIIRIVKIFDTEKLDPNNWETTETGDEFLALNPSFNFGFSTRKFLGFPCLELEAHSFTNKIFDIFWDFGDGTSGNQKEETKCYTNAGTYTITLTLKEKNSNFAESISKKIEIKEGIIVKTIKRTQEQIEKGIEFFSEKARMSFEKIGQITKDRVLVLKRKFPLKPIGIMTVDFARVDEKIEFQNVVFDFDEEKLKSIMYFPKEFSQIERLKILFLPIK